ncbi:hypothetical protein [Maricaulis sp.]|uniref:hypothetical protein n=1 Tax=Maricaulis sp. TaxID=1486257 RepID=UPI003A8D7EA4
MAFSLAVKFHMALVTELSEQLVRNAAKLGHGWVVDEDRMLERIGNQRCRRRPQF